jgi:hypothetical protein
LRECTPTTPSCFGMAVTRIDGGYSFLIFLRAFTFGILLVVAGASLRLVKGIDELERTVSELRKVD